MKTVHRHVSSAEGGFTLIEVLVAITLTVIVMSAVFGLLTRGQESFRREPQIANVNQNARSGLAMIDRDLRMAGFKTPPSTAVIWADGGGINPDGITIVYAEERVPLSQPDTNFTNGTIASSSTLFIDTSTFDPIPFDPEQAYEDDMILMAIETEDCNGDGQIGVTPFEVTQPPGCVAGCDRLSINHNPSAVSELNLPGGFNGEVDANCTVIGLFHVIQYRINPVPPTPNPMLERRDLSTGGPWMPVSMNIENLQVQYSVGSSTNFVDTPGQPNPEDPTTWITSVMVTVSGRSESTNLQGASQGVFATEDTHLRKAFSSTTSLRNVVNEASNRAVVFP